MHPLRLASITTLLASSLMCAAPATAQTSDDLFDPTVLHDIELTMKQGDWETLQANYLIDTYYPADMKWQEVVVAQVGVRSRGSGSRNAKIWEMKAEDWDFVLRLNLRPTFLCTRAAVPHMMRQRQGRIICMSSGAREGTPWTAYYAGGSAYSAAKAGVHGFVRDVALELAEYGINVNAVAPGPIDTERFGPGLKKLNETVEYSPNHMTPLRRLGQPFEVAHAVLFLASDEASYVTGHTLAVTGGR